MPLPKIQLLVLNSNNATSSVSGSDRTWILDTPLAPSTGNVFEISLQSFRIMHVFPNFPVDQTIVAGRTAGTATSYTLKKGNYTPTTLAQNLTSFLVTHNATMTYDGNNLGYTFNSSNTSVLPSVYTGIYFSSNTTILKQLGLIEAGTYFKSAVPVDFDNVTAINVRMASNSDAEGILAFAPFDTQYGFRYQYENENGKGFKYTTGFLNKIRIKLSDQNDIDLSTKYVVGTANQATALAWIPTWHVALYINEVPAKLVNPSC